MKTCSFVVAVSVALAAGLGLTSSDAYAWGPHASSSEMIRDRIVPHGFFTLPSEPRRVQSRRPLNRQRRFFVPNTVIGSGATFVGVYAPPGSDADPGYYPMEDPSTVFGAQPVYGQPVSNTVSAAPPAPSMPPAPPMPSVVEYPMGRYELRGDGMTSPYAWVWIPNPPPPPPVAAPAAPAGPVFSDDRPSRSSRRVYRWTDEQGVINVTDRLEAVPSRYRAQAAQAPPS